MTYQCCTTIKSNFCFPKDPKEELSTFKVPVAVEFSNNVAVNSFDDFAAMLMRNCGKSKVYFKPYVSIGNNLGSKWI